MTNGKISEFPSNAPFGTNDKQCFHPLKRQHFSVLFYKTDFWGEEILHRAGRVELIAQLNFVILGPIPWDTKIQRYKYYIGPNPTGYKDTKKKTK